MTGGIALAMPVGTVMYLVTEALLVRAHRVKMSPWAMPLFFGAFLLYSWSRSCWGKTRLPYVPTAPKNHIDTESCADSVA